ncbi:MAG: TetR/AcrR family transcriptional regulator [Gemmatimonadota bacterium]|nr:TetR/AcrR family transcriptional regulator [Gemmatimonadota bacterium]
MPTATFNKLDAAKKQKIISSAVDIFAARGYTRASVDSIAKEAGVAKGALYRYFTSKKDLYMEVVNTLVDEINEYAEEFMRDHTGNSFLDTIRDHLVSSYRLHQRFCKHREVLCNIFYQEDLEFKGEVLAKFGKLTTQYSRLLLQRGIARGEIRENIDLDAAGFIVESVCDRFIDGVTIPHLDYGFGLYQQPQEVINHKADLVIEAFQGAFGKKTAPEI